MAKKPIDYKGIMNIHGAEVTRSEAQFIDRTEKYKTIFEQASDYGINLFEKNSSVLQPDFTSSADGLVNTYLLRERAHQVLTEVDYETHKGVLPEIGNERSISFYIGGEKAFPAREYDPIADKGKTKEEIQNEYEEDMARELVKQRETKYVTQAVNSGLVINSTAQLILFYDAMGITTQLEYANYPVMTTAELEEYLIAIGIYYANRGDGMPVTFVSNSDWAKLVKSDSFLHSTSAELGMNFANSRHLKLGQIYDNIVIPYKELGMPTSDKYSGVHRFTVLPGNAKLIEQMIRPIKFRSANLAREEAHQTLDAEFISGTYQQEVLFVDNFKNEDGTVESFTKNVIICGGGTLAQDPNKVIAGTVHSAPGTGPTFSVAKNRTFSEMVNATYGKAGSTGKKPLPAEDDAGL